MRSLRFSLCVLSFALGAGLTTELSVTEFSSTRLASTRFSSRVNPAKNLKVSLTANSAWARSSGGRSGGGSFRRRPSTTRPSFRQRPSAPSRSQPRFPSGFNARPRLNSPSRNRNGPIFIPVPTRPRTQPRLQPQSPLSTSGGPTTNRTPPRNAANAVLMTLFVLLLGGGAIGLLLYFLIKSRTPVDPLAELNNDILTLSQLQVALFSNAGPIQQELSALTLETDTSTHDGLVTLLQESALILLRHSESWTHVHAESQTVPNLDVAQKVFNQMAIAERSKLSTETLVNVGGKVRQRPVIVPDPDEGPAAYIVVTLLVGTAHDQPLFQDIRTTTVLSQNLQKIAALPPEYLCVMELIWSPQDASDSLTYDELLTEYTDLAQI